MGPSEAEKKAEEYAVDVAARLKRLADEHEHEDEDEEKGTVS